MNSEEINNLLPFLLKKDNVARYEQGRVLICDRRAYPFDKTFYTCQDVEDVARAIEMMVTQGGGPWVAAAYAMAMAAQEAGDMPREAAVGQLEKGRTLSW